MLSGFEHTLHQWVYLPGDLGAWHTPTQGHWQPLPCLRPGASGSTLSVPSLWCEAFGVLGFLAHTEIIFTVGRVWRWVRGWQHPSSACAAQLGNIRPPLTRRCIMTCPSWQQQLPDGCSGGWTHAGSGPQAQFVTCPFSGQLPTTLQPTHPCLGSRGRGRGCMALHYLS